MMELKEDKQKNGSKLGWCARNLAINTLSSLNFKNNAIYIV